MRILIGIMLGGGLAMLFPEQAASAFEFVRDHVNSLASYIADQTRDNPIPTISIEVK